MTSLELLSHKAKKILVCPVLPLHLQTGCYIGTEDHDHKMTLFSKTKTYYLCTEDPHSLNMLPDAFPSKTDIIQTFNA